MITQRVSTGILVLCLLMLCELAQGKERHALLVGMAGRDSCQGYGPHQTLMARRVKNLKSTLLAQDYGRVDELYVCFDRYDYLEGGIQYLSSRKPSLIWTGYLPHVEQEFQALLKNNEETDVYLVGYSYGGWLALRSAQRIPFGAHQRLFLFSIDPISAKYCGPSEVILGSQGCLEAPRDLNFRTIAEKTENWRQFYQTKSNFIHSAAISYASNMRLHLGHTEIDDSSMVWNEIRKSVQQLSRRSSPTHRN